MQVLGTHEGRLVRCAQCDLVRNPDYATQTAEQRYQDDYFTGRVYDDYIANEHQWRHEARLRIAYMKDVGFTEPVLEIGSAAGFFLDELRHRGVEASGIEVSSSMALYATEVLHLPVSNADVTSVQLAPGSIGTVCMWHSLEHMHDPVRVLRLCHGWLSDGGRVFCEVPNYGSFGSRRHGARWPQLYLREHAFQFEPATIRKLFKAAGFRVLYLSTLPPEAYERGPENTPTIRLVARTLRAGALRVLCRLGDVLGVPSGSLMRVVGEKI
jgi:SAM-dependent methyltransferase